MLGGCRVTWPGIEVTILRSTIELRITAFSLQMILLHILSPRVASVVYYASRKSYIADYELAGRI